MAFTFQVGPIILRERINYDETLEQMTLLHAARITSRAYVALKLQAAETLQKTAAFRVSRMGSSSIVVSLCMLMVVVTFIAEAFATSDVQSETLRSGRLRQTLANPLELDKRSIQLFELFLVALVGVYCVVFYAGSRQNYRRASAVADSLTKLLDSQFAYFGVNDKGKRLLRDGQAVFWCHASGRRYTTGLSAMIELEPRMDMFAVLSNFIQPRARDRCTFFIPLRDFPMEPMSLFLARKKELLRLKAIDDGKALEEVKLLAGEVVEVSGLPNDFVAMTEHPDVTTALLTDSVRKALQSFVDELQSVHVTENGAAWEPQSQASKQLIRVSFTIPSQREKVHDVLSAAVRLSTLLIETCARAKLSAVARKKAVELRKQIRSEEDRERQKKRQAEMAAEREKRKKEREEAVYKMSADKQAKYDEKKRKKAYRERLRKATK